MKVVLREHVDHLGERGQIVRVAAGYARNYLLPKGLAVTATPGNLKVIEQQRRVWAAREAKELGDAKALAERLGQLRLSVVKKAGETGTLYGSVTNGEIAELLLAAGFEIDRRRIGVHDPIKAVGEFEVPVKVHREVTARVHLHVEGEKQPEPETPGADAD